MKPATEAEPGRQPVRRSLKDAVALLHTLPNPPLSEPREPIELPDRDWNPLPPTPLPDRWGRRARYPECADDRHLSGRASAMPGAV